MKKPLRFALIGQQAWYSKSPDVFKAVFDATGLTGSFEVLDVTPRQLGQRIRQQVLDGLSGFSVTIPYKQAVIEFIDDVTPAVQVLGAANCIGVDGSHLYGYNTDVAGFSLPLREHRIRIKKKPALILGCGGAALAAVYALYHDFEVREFSVVGRDAERLATFARSLSGSLERASIATQLVSGSMTPLVERCSLVVNCTPVGGWNDPDSSLLPPVSRWKGVKIYYDLNYNQGNKLVAAARSAGKVGIDGSAMLVGQALQSFDIWTGQSVDHDTIYDRVFGTSH
ncbi:MAG: hypothetical protein KKA42_07355 [candidate division Zixibacteria bacterium]|nr:hypothetical protein [candidate division Zixibacteria bacterium]